MLELVNNQFFVVIMCLAAGGLMGLSYDILRIIRRILPHNVFFCCIEDVLYWLAWLLIMIFFVQTYNYGSVRWYVYAGIFLGVTLYECTLGRLIMFIFSHIIAFCRKLISRDVQKKEE